MNKGTTLLSGLGLGAGLMYLLDPERGRRRRAVLRDRLTLAWRKQEAVFSKALRDLNQRASGWLAEARALARNTPVSDDVLVERVRARLGRVVSHPHAIGVTADQGRVTLSGPILAREVDDLIARVYAITGVTGVENNLEVYQKPDHISALQGGRARYAAQRNWPPAAQLLAGAGGSAVLGYGMKRGGMLGTGAALLGLGLLARGVSNMELRRLLGLSAGRRAVDIQKTLHIAAPLERVFEFWSNYQNFPYFMSHVDEVRDLGDDRSHWVARGPAGLPVEWDALLTEYVPNEVLAWKSIAGSALKHAGRVRFTPDGTGTRVHIKMSYNPPAGVLGHALASLLGQDLKSLMDKDLLSVKTLLEAGKTSAHGAHIIREPSAARPH